MANKEITPEKWDEYDSDGESYETIDNKQRGCGFLKAGNSYIRCDAEAFGEDGVLPGFVVFTDSEGSLHPIPYKESLPRGYRTINGSNFLAAAETQRTVTPLYPGDSDAEESHQAAHQRALENMADKGVYPTAAAAPNSELARHMDRMAIDGFGGQEHWGAITPANSKDLLMRVGKSYYDSPWDYIEETLELGLNKGISVHSNKSPPTVQPGRTRVWLIHPHACGEDMPGVIGFCYLTRTIFTRDKDGNVPAYAEDYDRAGKLDVVDIGEPEPQEEDEGRDYEDIAETHQALDDFDPDADVGEAAVEAEPESEPDAESDPGSYLPDETVAVETPQSAIEPQEIEDMDKATLGDLAGQGWKFAEHPPEDHDAVQDGGLLGIVQQDGTNRKVAASNNFKFDAETGQGSTRLGPYTVELELSEAGRQIRVEQ